jgi:hypothetical protein
VVEKCRGAKSRGAGGVECCPNPEHNTIPHSEHLGPSTNDAVGACRERRIK